jgi:PAS domain S-box-containing protein
VAAFDDESGRFSGYRGVGIDITGQPTRQAAADDDAEARTRYREAVETAQLGIWDWDVPTGALSISPGLEATLGYDEGAFPGTIEAWNEHVHPHDRDRVRTAMDRHLARQAPSYEAEHRIVTRDGEVRWFLARGRAEWDSAGEVARVTVGLADVTPIKWRESDLSEAVAAARVAERTRGEFLAQLSHELRTPLNAIIGFSEAIKEGYLGPLSTEKSREYASDVHAASTHLLEIINDVLDLSRIDAGGLELHEDEIDVNEVVDGSVRLVEGRAANGMVELTVEVPAGMPRLRADPRLIKQTLLNLLTNAVKFTPEGGKVTISAARRADGGIEITVTDTGTGIRPEDIQRALEPFAQVGEDVNRRDEGSGLGLPLARSIMELHGGSLELKSEPGRGTEAIVVFPPHRTSPDGSL